MTGTVPGMHTNFSTQKLREEGGQEYFEKLMKHSASTVKSTSPHTVRQPHALTGLHETQSIDKFNYGVANRGALDPYSSRLRQQWLQGISEDRRPNSQADPYKIISRILKTIASVG
ncbi:MAG: hypothetical protein R3B96_21260 [Pirellulaceae bacterium]